MSFSKLMCYLIALIGAVGLAIYSTSEEDVAGAIVYALVLTSGLIIAGETK